MKRILVTACGGPSALSFTRSLRDADPDGSKYRIIGMDCNRYNVHRAEVDYAYISPRAEDPNYIPFIKYLIQKESINFLHTQPEIEVFIVGKYRREILVAGCWLFMPPQKTIELLRDKSKSYKVWRDAGITVPKNIEIHNEDDLKLAYKTLGENIWIRETIGAGARGSLSRPSYEMAFANITAREGWGKTLAAEHLTSDTITWQSIWYNGKLVVAQGRKRIHWAFSNKPQSGVSGATGVGATITDSELDELAIKCILVADPTPHGIFSVDFTYDKAGVPNPTEINISKFFTTHHFTTRTGCNMPSILIQLAFDEYDGSYNILNPCKPDMFWVRGMDILPVLLDTNEIIAKEDEYEKILKEIS